MCSSNARARPYLAALGVAGVLAAAGNAHAVDGCTLFRDANLQGVARMLELPAVSATLGIEPTGNTSYRAQESLVSPVDGVSSARVVAGESDAALYVFDGRSFDGKGYVLHCRQGQTCWIDLTSVGFGDRVRSAICQREFGRKRGRDPRNNGIIDLKLLSDAAVAVVRAQNFRHLKWVVATATSRTAYSYCQQFTGGRLCSYPASKYLDLVVIQVHSKIETGPRDVEFAVDFYGYFVGGPKFLFVPVRTRFHVWGSGPLRERIVREALVKFLGRYDVGRDITARITAAAATSGITLDGMRRVELGFLNPAKLGQPSWGEPVDTRSTTPKLIINRTRDARY